VIAGIRQDFAGQFQNPECNSKSPLRLHRLNTMTPAMDRKPITSPRLAVVPVLWRWTKRLIAVVLVLVVLALLGGATFQFVATQKLERKHPAPGRLFDVGGHRLHLHSQGNGSPAVIIDAGLSGASYDWETVATGISAFSSVCTYDRAGYGWSDLGPRPRTSQRAVAELRALLRAAKIEPPFILVGHSWGGLNVRLYASEHPGEVAGVVLVDALNTDGLPPDSNFNEVSPVLKFLKATACCGSTWLAAPAFIKEPSNDRAALKLRQGMLSRAKSIRAICDELEGEANWLAVRSVLRPLGNLPVAVISRHIVERPSTDSLALTDQDWLRGQKALPQISSNSTFIMAHTDIHDLQFHEPELIVNAVRQMVGSVRNSEPFGVRAR
jgi:pimeloyl-ACP methyl ester carboxylesterase